MYAPCLTGEKDEVTISVRQIVQKNREEFQRVLWVGQRKQETITVARRAQKPVVLQKLQLSTEVVQNTAVNAYCDILKPLQALK